MHEKIKIGIIDYGLGNLYSVQKACSSLEMETLFINSCDEFSKVNALILPGVGAFGEAMKRLKNKKLDTGIIEKVNDGMPLLGICLGMQLLMTYSEEFGYHEGLNLIEGKVVRFSADKSNNLKIPQIQWNTVKLVKQNHTIFSDIPSPSYFYFLHSYCVIPENSDVILSTSEYLNMEYCSAFKKDNVFGTQFHPEKSGLNGLKLLDNFKTYIKNGKH
jgi:glutamine amidotransferase